MKKKKGVVVFLVMIIAMLLLGYYSYGIVKGTAAKDNEKGIKLGLDLAGGVSITYQVKGDETPSAEDMKDTVYKLQKRVETYSTEAEVYQVGETEFPWKFRVYLMQIQFWKNLEHRVLWNLRPQRARHS